MNSLVQRAIRKGATRAALIPAQRIQAEEKLAALCRKPQCKNFGQSMRCPPNVAGPAWFKDFVKNKKNAILVRIDLPASVLFSEQRWEILYLLHEIVSDVEQTAIGMGFRESKAFAGSSCKEIFCQDHAACRELSGSGPCRHPDIARPSMSGFGIHVAALMAAAGWSDETNVQAVNPSDESMSWVAGLIVIG